MTLLLYAIAGSDPGAIGGTGLGGRYLEGIHESGLVAIVSALEGGCPEPNAETLWAYEAAVEALMDRHVILPARYGTVLGDPSAARALLRDQAEHLIPALNQVRGAVELSLRVRWRDDVQANVEADPGIGTAYMLGRLEVHRRATQVVRRLACLRELARSSRSRLPALPEPQLTAAY